MISRTRSGLLRMQRSCGAKGRKNCGVRPASLAHVRLLWPRPPNTRGAPSQPNHSRTRSARPPRRKVRAVLALCHEPDLQQAYVRDIASAVNRIYVEEGESLKMSSETVGHILKSIGFYSRRLGSAGRGLVLDKSMRSHAHRLGHAYEVLPPDPACVHCHELQGTPSEELM